MLDFDWDLANTEHIARHDVIPAEAEEVIANSPLEIGNLERNGELRIVHVGETDFGRILIVAITYRANRIRVVTAYTANRKLRKFYAEQIARTNETDIEDT